LRYAQSPCTARAGNHARPPADRKTQHPVGRWGWPKNGKTPLTRKKRAVSSNVLFFRDLIAIDALLKLP
jgi:hypothetical protein